MRRVEGASRLLRDLVLVVCGALVVSATGDSLRGHLQLPGLAPRTVRSGFEQWLQERLSSATPAAVFGVVLDRPSSAQGVLPWLESLSRLQPLVQPVVFCWLHQECDSVQALGIRVLRQAGPPAAGAISVRRFSEQLFSAFPNHAALLPKLWGLCSMGVSFPEPLAVVESLLGIALDLEQSRLPIAVAVVGRARDLPLSDTSIQTLRQPPLTPRALVGVAADRSAGAGAGGSGLRFVFFTPSALRMGSRSGHAPASPAALLSAVVAQRCGFWRASQDGQRGLAIAAGTALVDVSLTMPATLLTFGPPPAGGEGAVASSEAIRSDPDQIPNSAEFATAWRAASVEAGPAPPPVVELRVRLGVVHGTASTTSPCSMVGPGAVLGLPSSQPGPPLPSVDPAASAAAVLPSPAQPSSTAAALDPAAASAAASATASAAASATASPTVAPPSATASPSALSDATPPLASPPGAVPTAKPGVLLSVFTTLFDKDRSTPEGEQKYLIQRNTLIAFANLGESVEMTVFTDSPQIQALCAELAPSVVCSSNFRTNSHGTPVLKSMYLHIENATAAPFYGYVNADIIFTDALLKALRAVQRGIHEGVLHRRVLVVGKRTNFEMPFPLTMSSPMVLNRSSGPSVIDKMAARGKVFQPDAEDFFFVHRNSLDWSQIADFVIGRVAYDNWLVDHAFHQGLDRVDVTNTVHAVHQTGHDGNMAGHTPRVDSNWNKDLATKHGGGYDHGTTDHGNFETRWHGPEMHLIARPQWHAKNRDELLEQQQSMREA